MARRRHIRVKMRNSLHGTPIAIPDKMSKVEAAEILRGELSIKTPIDTGAARQDWNVVELSNGDVRVKNKKPYIRRLMIDGSSGQQDSGAYNRAIMRARTRIKSRGEQLREAEESVTGKKISGITRRPQVRGQIK